MSRRNIYSVVGLITVLFSIWFFTNSGEEKKRNTESVKVTLRNVGHQLLLSNEDSTSLVLPVEELENFKFRVSFQNTIFIEPRNLVSIIQNNFEKASLSSHYLVEVITCTTDDVVYSYEIKNTEENSIIPCFGRVLENNCYTINIEFKDRNAGKNTQALFYVLAIITFLLIQILFYKRIPTNIAFTTNDKHETLGSFKFYPDQNKLIKEAVEICLSKKECELLTIFVSQPNKIIKRSELEKRVWEDNGVFVGRSLDTYISKLRKILKADDSIKLTNVHGIGYMLEIHL